MTEENLLVEDTKFDEQVTADDVKAYINNLSTTNLQTIKVEETKDTKKITLGADTIFDTSLDSKANSINSYDNMYVTIKDDLHPITRKEREDYLLACLNDELYTMELELMPLFTITCRDLNLYESKVVLRVLFNYVNTNPNAIMAVLVDLMRQVRIPMQIVAVAGNPVDNIKFEYNPGEQSDTQLDRDAKKLLEQADALQMNTPYAKYQLYLKALNVFEHKMKRLEEASFNENFWKPADHD